MGGNPNGNVRVAVLNSFLPDAPFAEREEFDPDLVLSIHPQAAPKLTRHLTVACDWNPAKIHRPYNIFKQNERSCDGWLSAGEDMRRRSRNGGPAWHRPPAGPDPIGNVYPSASLTADLV